MNRKLIADYHDLIVSMRNKGKTYKEIGSITGFSKDALYSYCADHNIKKSNVILDNKELIKQMKSEGYNIKQIASKLNLSQWMLYYYKNQRRL